MANFIILRITIFLFIGLFTLTSCKTIENLPGGDARENPPDPKARVKKNLEEGRGFRLDDALKGKGNKGGDFMFASANELWRASLDTLDFMPLSSVNYSGGIIITDWYNDGKSSGQSVKISVRFLTNEVRADALDIKVFTKNCETTIDCKVSQNKGALVKELTRSILKKAAIYEKEYRAKNKKKYEYSKPDNKR